MDTNNELLNEKVYQAQTDDNILEGLILGHKGFLLSSAYQATGRYISESDDMWSVTLQAFNEAVRSFSADKGNFHTFAALVIKRRLIDHMKSEKRFESEISVNPGSMESISYEDLSGPDLKQQILRKEAAQAFETARAVNAQESIKEEILSMQKILQTYGFSFYDLADASPKAEKTKASCARAVITLLNNPALLYRMREKRTLPIKDVEQISGVPRKILDRHRKYIIAAAEIMAGDYPGLAVYMHFIRKAMWAK